MAVVMYVQCDTIFMSKMRMKQNVLVNDLAGSFPGDHYVSTGTTGTGNLGGDQQRRLIGFMLKGGS